MDSPRVVAQTLSTDLSLYYPATHSLDPNCGKKTFRGDWSGAEVRPSFAQAMRWRATTKPPPFPTPATAQSLAVKIDYDRLMSPPSTDELQATWMGHASFLIQVNGINILTDPVWSDRCSPLSFVGPKRFVKVPLPLEDMPRIDVVTISHNHYDHLDAATVAQLATRFRSLIHFVVPLGMKGWFRHLEQRGFDVESRVHELDWWSHTRIDFGATRSIFISAVPVQHWSMRTGPWDRNTQLWCGFVYEVPHTTTDDTSASPRYVWRMFHSGDTGYNDTIFKKIGSVFGKFDLALIPIGAYEPRWFMAPQHVDPAQAVQIHLDLNRPQQSLGMHWGTFILTDEPIEEPPVELERQAAAAGLAPKEFIALKHGQTVNISAA